MSSKKEKENKKRRSLPSIFARSFLIFFSSLLFLVALVLLLIQTASVQNFARKKIVSFLEQKLDTKVQIERLDVSFPKMLVLEGVYIEDRTGDTLLAGHQLMVDINLMPLLYNEIQINEINLNGITAKIKRPGPDTLFNFQFIVDAFTPKKIEPDRDSVTLSMAVEKLIVEDTRVVFYDGLRGDDVAVHIGHLDTRIDEFDPDKLVIEAPSMNLGEISGTYKNKGRAIAVTFSFKNLEAVPEKIDARNLLFALREVEINEFDFTFDDQTKPLLSTGLDYAHLDVQDLFLRANKVFYHPDTISANITSARLTEKSGAVLRDLEATFQYTIGDGGLHIPNLQFSGFQNTQGDLSGTLLNVTDPNLISADLRIRNFSTSLADIQFFVPPGQIPDNITLPDALSLNGTLKGGLDRAEVDLFMYSSSGEAKINGTISQVTDPNTATYAAEIFTLALDVGKIIQQPETIGKITAGLIVHGKGFDPNTADATVKGLIQSIEFKQYNYQNIHLDGAIAKQKYSAKGGMQDPNLHFAFEANGELGGAHPGFFVKASIDSIKTGPLNLTPNPIIYRGEVVANFPELNLDALNGEIYLVNSLLVANNQRINLDSVEVIAVYENGQQVIAAKTDFLHATITGVYKLVQLGDIFIHAIQPYYALQTDTLASPPDPYDFTIDARVIDHHTLRAFIPDLKRMDEITMAGKFSSANGWNASILSPYITYGASTLADLNLTASTGGDRLRVVTSVAEISNGENFELLGTRLRADIANDQVDFALRIGDEAKRDKYRLNGLLSQEPEKVFALSLHPDSLMLNYEPWTINEDNLVRFGPSIINADNFDLSKDEQHLIIQSESADANSPMEVQFADFRLVTLTGFVQPDSTLADGILNGTILLNDLTTQPNFTTDLTISNLSVNRDTIGDLNAKIDNTKSNVFATNLTITGRGNDVALTGNYYLKAENNSNMDLNLNIKSLQLKTIEAASMGSIRDGKGFLSGNVDIGGTIKVPDIAGTLSFHKTSVVVTALNSEFRIDEEQIIAVDDKGLRFNSFTVRDFSENKLTLHGLASTKNYLNYEFDLSLKANNFRALNSTKKDNDLYYGQLFFDTNLRLSGTESSPVIDGALRINEDTRLTVVLPQSQPGVVEREGVVVFTDKDAPLNDSLFLAAMDSLNKTTILGMELSTNIEIDKKAVINLVIDEGNGDFIKLQGEAILNGGIDKSGKITLTGSYELDEGAYEMSFNLLRRRFDIQRGSKIVWTGEPTDGNLDITAVYIANASAMDLVQDQITGAKADLRYRQRLPFEVHLKMTGPLMQPILTFDIILPEESTVRIDNEIAGQVEMRLSQLKAEPSELNKQVFALLLLNRFVSENPFENPGGGITAGSFARQSVSKILTEQLNNLASTLITGVDLNFDVVSTEDYTSGSLQNKTDLNVGVSKALMNDRLNVSVGTNFELEGGSKSNQDGTAGSSISPNLNVEYFLTQDGRYLVRAYRNNEYEGVTEGYVVETGIGLVMSVDYVKFREIFERKKIKRDLKKDKKGEK